MPMVAAAIWDPVKDMFTDWTTGNLSENVAKYVFVILLGIVIFSILEFTPFFNKLHTSLKVIATILIAFLGTAYLTPKEVYLLVAGYGAMGMIFGILIPIIILIAFSAELRKMEGYKGELFGSFLWVLFIVFLIWKVGQGYVNDIIGTTEMAIYLAAILLSVIWLLVQKKILSRVSAGEDKADNEERVAGIEDAAKRKMRDELTSLEAEDARLAAEGKPIAGGDRMKLQDAIKELKFELTS